MSRGKKTLLVVFGIPLLLFGMYKLAYPSYSWHQKITVVVETPQGLRTGYSVSSAYGGPSNYFSASLGYAVKSGASGEAVVVELPDGRYLFALVSGGPFNAGINVIAHNVFSDKLPDDPRGRYGMLSRLRESRPVPHDMYPMLVTFTDINDPASVKKVDPDDLATSFGAGYSLKSITLEITDEKVTEGVAQGVLGWFRTHAGYLSGANRLDHSRPELNLTIGDFIKGAIK